MTIRGSGRSLLILAAGLFVCLAGPSPAAANADDNVAATNPVSPEPASAEAASPGSGSAAGEPTTIKNNVKKKHAHRKSGRVALKSSAANKAHAADVAPDDGGTSTAVPPAVANANARMAFVDAPAGNARAMSAWADHIMQTGSDSPADTRPAVETQVVSPDELNDVDRTLPASAPPAPRMAMASADTPVEPATASSNESSPWDKASLIGKIFMGFGGLLTLASAVRMLMA